jgi:uncharacterized damage-inducible protein DinB
MHSKMHARELLAKQVEETGQMLLKALDGVDESQYDFRVHDSMMSIRDHVHHLCEAYTAFLKHAEKQPHEWRSYNLADKSRESLVRDFVSLRNRATALIDGEDEEQILHSGAAYIANHDSYHIGQIAATRQAMDPSWSSYALYS